MNFLRNIFIFLFLLFAEVILASPSDNPLLQKGWAALVRDDENEAFNYFWQAFKKAQKNKIGLCFSIITFTFER